MSKADAKIIFRTTSPAALKAHAAAGIAAQRQRTVRAAFEDDMLLRFGAADITDRDARYETRRDRRALMVSAYTGTVTGLDCGPQEVPPKGSGWRRDAHRGHWVPDRRQRAGKDLEERLATLTTFRASELLDVLGVPSDVATWADGHHWMSRPFLDPGDGGDALYFGFAHDTQDIRDAIARAAVPSVRWEPVARSAWLALLESRGEA